MGTRTQSSKGALGPPSAHIQVSEAMHHGVLTYPPVGILSTLDVAAALGGVARHSGHTRRRKERSR